MKRLICAFLDHDFGPPVWTRELLSEMLVEKETLTCRRCGHVSEGWRPL